MVIPIDEFLVAPWGSLGLLGTLWFLKIPKSWVANALARHGSDRLRWANYPPPDDVGRSGLAIEAWEFWRRKSRFAEGGQQASS